MSGLRHVSRVSFLMSLSRRADGLGCKPTLLGRLSVIFNDLRNSPPEPFMDCIASVEKQGTIPGVKEAADRILHMAKDAVEFGHLKECGLSVDDVAMIMQYSAEDTVPPFYKELNRVCYDRDRTNAHALREEHVASCPCSEEVTKVWEVSSFSRGEIGSERRLSRGPYRRLARMGQHDDSYQSS